MPSKDLKRERLLMLALRYILPENNRCLKQQVVVNKCSAVAETGDHWPQWTWAEK